MARSSCSIPSGRSDFERLQPRMHSARPSAALRREHPVDYYVFDLLYCDGYDLRDVPLIERKRLLRLVLDPLPPVRISDHVLDQGKELFRLASGRGAEGVVAKRLTSTYTGGRGEDWFKVKAVKEVDAVIGGYTASRGAGRPFGALLAGLYNGDRLEFIGGVGSGFSGRVLDELFGKLAPLATDRCPFAARARRQRAHDVGHPTARRPREVRRDDQRPPAACARLHGTPRRCLDARLHHRFRDARDTAAEGAARDGNARLARRGNRS